MGSFTVRFVAIAVLVTAPCAAQAPSLDFLDVPDRPDDDRSRANADEVEALGEMRDELARFEASARAYRGSVDALVRRRLTERQRGLAAQYARQLRDERSLETGARRRAMREIETFLARHPRGARADQHRPEMMLRLAELIVLTELEREEPDFARAVGLAQRILREHPDYGALDRAAYLAGYGLWEMGRHDEALAAWRGLVCANRFGFERPSAPDEEPALQHPALTSPVRGVPALGPNPYEGCTQAMESPLLAEVWLRIGEHHFERGPGELAAAIGAYQRIVERPRDALYGFGLYKLAWSYYRASRFAEAIERFGALVEYSDRQLEATGRAGSELRREALQYIAIALAYDDWNEDGAPDGVSQLERAAEQLPADRPWARDAMRALGDVLFEEARYPEAIAAWRQTLRLSALTCDRADVLLAIVRAYRRHGDEAGAFAALGEIPNAVTTSMGTCSSEDRHRAARIAEDATLAIAVTEHQRAQRLRASGRDPEARIAYEAAVRAYDVFLAQFPNHERAYSILYDRADALYWSGSYERAAQAYEAVRDSRIDDRFFAAAARRAVESYARVLDAEVAAGRTRVREDAPIENAQVTAIAVPPALQRVARAREIYVRWVDAEEDSERVRDAYAFNNAVLLYQYGFWPQARERFDRLFRDHCRGPAASDVALSAWRAMQRMAAATENVGEADRLNIAMRDGACVFAAGGSPVAGELAEREADVELTRLRDDIRALEREDDTPARRARAESIAARLVAVVDRNPSHAQGLLALSNAAHVLEDVAFHPGAAERVYQRIVDTEGGDPTLVLDARFQLARIAHRRFDVESALAGYAAVAGSPRSEDARIAAMQNDALVNGALLASSAGRHGEAAGAWARAAERLGGTEAREAGLRSAEERLRAGDAREAARLLDAWTRSQRTSDGLNVRAHIARADAARALHDARGRTRSLEAAVRAHRDARAEPGLAAQAALELANTSADAFHSERIRVPALATTREAVADLARRVNAEAARYRPVLDAYEQVIAIGSARESQAALEREGALFEALIRTVLESEVALPRDLQRALRAATPAVRAAARASFEQAIHARLDEEVRPVECRAVERYLLALRLAQREGADAPQAVERLSAYGEERVRDCVRSAIERDPTFSPLAPGELARARAGLAAPPAHGTAPPPIAR